MMKAIHKLFRYSNNPRITKSLTHLQLGTINRLYIYQVKMFNFPVKQPRFNFSDQCPFTLDQIPFVILL